MPKYLIVYATREGQTEKIALKIKEHLSNCGVSSLVHNIKKPLIEKIETFDFILCGGSMHAGGIEKELVQFLNENKDTIESKKNGFFLVLLSAATKNQELKKAWLTNAKSKMDEQIKVRFSKTEMIAGALTYSKYPWPLKWIMRRIAKQAGEGTNFSKDYEYTDWNQVKDFALSLAPNNADKPQRDV